VSAALSISLVTYHPDVPVLRETIESLKVSVGRAVADGRLASATLYLVDNGPGGIWAALLAGLLDDVGLAPVAPAGALHGQLLTGHGNVGYGRGHNLALQRSTADYHLVLNPDVLLAEDALSEGMAALEKRRDVGMLAPLVTDQSGRRQFLCKRYPSVFDLWLRGFAPDWLKSKLDARMRRYEMRDETATNGPIDVPIISGCFMLARRRVLEQVGGFASRYFLYFEDFDLSLRVGAVSTLAFVPSVRIVHSGGGASRKGLHHLRLFVRSGIRFFSDHGWKWW
jgi:GT2 family glycosyltransferase